MAVGGRKPPGMQEARLDRVNLNKTRRSKMKKMFSKIMVGLFISSLIIVTFGVCAWSADKYELRYASEYPDKHPTVRNAILPWIDEVKKLSGGRLKIILAKR